ncbi:MAG: response regulator [Sideroxyarcus sp.]|nr:response regulator [Sideroxyarcus sp.]
MPNILWIDDQPQWLSHVSKELPSDFNIIFATTTSEAIKALRTNHDLDVIVLDAMLTTRHHAATSERDGVMLLEAFRSRKLASKPIPVIVYSAYLDLGYHAEEMIALGVDAFVRKHDTNPHQLAFEIQRQISMSRQKPPSRPEEASLVAKIRAAFREEIAKSAPAREHTLDIPGDRGFALIKPLIGYKHDIEKQLARFAYEQNVFLMMKFRHSNRELGEFIIENLATHGLRGVRADQDDWNITRNVYNPIAVLYCCKFGIALFDEAEEHQAYSANVAYELGMMHSHNKDCLILKHASLPDLPFDLIKDLHFEYDRDLGVRSKITAWIRQVRAK